jgi:hypothetical protein
VTRKLTVTDMKLRGSPLILYFLLTFIAIGTAANRGQYGKPDPKIRAWFNTLSSRRSINCCATSDGVVLLDVDWGRQNKANSHYWVNLHGNKFDVPDEALVTQENKLGVAIVWTYVFFEVKDLDGNIIHPGQLRIRCFMPGLES